jgi:hypothetical protein
MTRQRWPPSEPSQTCLANHVRTITAAGFFTELTATYRLRFVFVLIVHAHRRVVHVAVTEHIATRGPTSHQGAPVSRPIEPPHSRDPAARRSALPLGRRAG